MLNYHPTLPYPTLPNPTSMLEQCDKFRNREID